MIPVYRARNLTDAQMLVEHLERQGIDTFVRNLDLQGTELIGIVPPEVCVLEPKDFEQARTISLEFDALLREEVVGEDRPCPRCKALNPPNFETCWSCRSMMSPVEAEP